jgi:uncharacterized membrane protein
MRVFLPNLGHKPLAYYVHITVASVTVASITVAVGLTIDFPEIQHSTLYSTVIKKVAENQDREAVPRTRPSGPFGAQGLRSMIPERLK